VVAWVVDDCAFAFKGLFHRLLFFVMMQMLGLKRGVALLAFAIFTAFYHSCYVVVEMYSHFTTVIE